MFALQRILVPTNLREPSRAAIKYGVAFARQFGAQLFLVHALAAREFAAAIETERVLEVFGTDRAEPSPDEVARNAAREELGRLLAPQDARDTRAEYLLRSYQAAAPDEAIVACAVELGVELIVMGKHPLGFVEQLLGGSVAEKVIRHAPCPVLIVQQPEHDFVV